MNAIHHRAILFALIAALGTLSACGNGNQKDTLEGYIGPGSGGQPTSPVLGTPVPPSPIITRPDGTIIGQFTYQDGFFSFTNPDPTQIGLLTAIYAGAPVLTIIINHISGRVDTPCRFNAAILARDGGFDIGNTGFRRNNQGLELYQVDLNGHGQFAQLFCANLLNNAGAQFSVVADAPDKVSWLQVYAVLNSIHPQ